ncbi:glycosyltransferase [Candidatus Methylacidithermus pantelleriae]|uniref:Putative Glycos_transf_1 domain-containing protein n=1 Tax=Candidatus Methylacidithermus pantelleriae TaxID=2744239 RepID=A0A8J2BRE7_9BACT|nr:glycosyltransferase [Candidatus Methylacidithermus pantelleriae]CAF0701227.1 putative Glycos_transf_1 domain-containing protein [Candidatus Methylacidithermus pantelleriae]
MILVDVTAATRSLKHTGVERWIRYFYHHFSARYQVIPLVWDPLWRLYARLSPREKFLLSSPLLPQGQQGQEPVGLSFFFGRLAQHWDHAYRRVGREIFSQNGVYLFTLENVMDTRSQFLQAWITRGTRWIAVLHDLIPLHTGQARSHSLSYFVSFLQQLPKAYAVICPSQAVRTEYLQWCEASGIPLTTQTLVFPWPPSLPVDRPHVLPNYGSRRVLCVSSFNERKNHRTLLHACEILWKKGCSFQLVLVGRIGKGFESTVEELRQHCRREGWPVLWFHHVDDETLVRLYGEASFTVFPSLDEGFGFPILESTWLGRPCICSREGASGELAAAGGCLVTDVHSPEKLSSAMEELLTSPATYQRLFEECKRRPFPSWDSWIQTFAHELGLPVSELHPESKP